MEGAVRQGPARGMIMVGMVSGRFQEHGRAQETGMGQELGSVKGHLYRGLGGDMSLGMVQEPRKRQSPGWDRSPGGDISRGGARAYEGRGDRGLGGTGT